MLVGASGSGKSTFAASHFAPTEVLSSDAFRALVADDPTDQSATDDAFAALRFVVGRRLARGRLTVVDATNVSRERRKGWVDLAREHHLPPVAIVLDLPRQTMFDRNAERRTGAVPDRVVTDQRSTLRRSLTGIGKEGFRIVHVLSTEEEVAGARLVRQPLPCDRRRESGPFDIVGDVHGCREELVELLARLGYEVDTDQPVRPPPGRRAIFLGDLTDRGPDPVGVLRLVMGMVEAGAALCLPGNHDAKLLRALRERKVRTSHGLAGTLEALDAEPAEFRRQVADFVDGLASHLVLDDGRLVVAHAGLREDLHGRSSGAVRSFALYGDTTGQKDEFGLPIRRDWAAGYRGRATVVYGHSPVSDPTWVNRTINIDTGCAFGGRLTALRYPELELVSVDARRTYAEPGRPFLAPPGRPPSRS